MKRAVLLFLAILMISFTSAAVQVQEISSDSIIIKETSNPAKYILKMTNTGPTESFEIYSLIGISMSPKGTFVLESGIPTDIEVEVYPSSEIRRKNHGPFIFEYQIRSPSSGITQKTLRFDIVEFEEVLKINTASLSPDETSLVVEIENTKKAYLENVKVNLESRFFEHQETISFSPNEKKQIQIPITNDISKLEAGTYEIKAHLEYDDAEANLEGDLKYLERGGIAVSENSEGIVVVRKTTEKTNEGNIRVTAQVTESKTLLSRLFTSHSPNPDTTEKKGFLVDYTWERELAPSESLKVVSTTNYTWPLVFIIIVVLGGLAVKIYTDKPIQIKKNVSFVRTKGEELALKVTLHVKSRTHADNIQVIDRLPMMAKLYEKFGVKPDKIEQGSRRMFWNIPRLNAGEERVFSYIMYSTMKVVGRFELPSATALYEKEGKIHESISNKAYFAAETTNSD